jgi:hypothetical protein
MIAQTTKYDGPPSPSTNRRDGLGGPSYNNATNRRDGLGGPSYNNATKRREGLGGPSYKARSVCCNHAKSGGLHTPCACYGVVFDRVPKSTSTSTTDLAGQPLS